ncbi:3-oxoacyl-[acyl-carrier-protein] reductase [Candidatus Fermentibacteria bacterium]|nr:3-oxoacyl-[acyl-carrier-protein] reductase [Candidatus Fermentibacteria bacterium]
MLDGHGQTAVVTGAARGIGRSIAVALAGTGMTVVGVDMASMEDTQEAAEATGSSFHSRIMNVTDPAQVQDLSLWCTQTLGGASVLVNNAGITRDNLLIRMKQEEWDAVLSVNLKAAFLLTQAFARSMMKARFGRIVNIASIIGLIGNAGQANYAAAKAGLIALTKSAAKELAPRNVTVNAVAPGFIETAMTAALSQEIREKYLRSIPLGRFGTPEDIANVVLFLCSPNAAYVTGHVITVDGGVVM